MKEAFADRNAERPIGTQISGSPYVATPTTGVVCHATCRNARRIWPENRRAFRSAKEATDVGYRPEVCRRVAAA